MMLPVSRSLRVRGAIDLGFAALYAWLGFSVAPGRSRSFDLTLGAVCLLLAVSGGLQIADRRGARLAARVAATVLLLFCAALIALLVLSFVYLRTIWGPLGQAAGWISLVVAALAVEGFGLWPIAQLRFHARADVKSHFGVAPSAR